MVFICCYSANVVCRLSREQMTLSLEPERQHFMLSSPVNGNRIEDARWSLVVSADVYIRHSRGSISIARAEECRTSNNTRECLSMSIISVGWWNESTISRRQWRLERLAKRSVTFKQWSTGLRLSLVFDNDRLDRHRLPSLQSLIISM